MRLLHACAPSCKRLPVDLTDSEPARERLRALKTIDRMVAGGRRRGDALRAAGLARSTYYDWRRAYLGDSLKALAPRSTRPHGVRPRQWTKQDRRLVEAERRLRACDHPRHPPPRPGLHTERCVRRAGSR